jgi:hypothetical protein
MKLISSLNDSDKTIISTKECRACHPPLIISPYTEQCTCGKRQTGLFPLNNGTEKPIIWPLRI